MTVSVILLNDHIPTNQRTLAALLRQGRPSDQSSRPLVDHVVQRSKNLNTGLHTPHMSSTNKKAFVCARVTATYLLLNTRMKRIQSSTSLEHPLLRQSIFTTSQCKHHVLNSSHSICYIRRYLPHRNTLR